ncbi:PAS domain S-box protein [uncultured Photobacterium sp.]|uniref:PAS domain S-box protein n=1 Tax=uncultured Photobacterium sp. TaxID=173973 RepID=UPI00261EDDC1|nr:PAS domain S-box protein [uncultured Photobacterium sp.]
MGAVISYFDFFEQVILGAVIEAQTIQLVTLTLISVILVSVMAIAGLMIWYVIAPLKKLANCSQHFFPQQDSQYSEDLTEHELIYRAAFSQAAVGIARVDISGRWLEVNQKLCDIIGYSKEELLKTNFQAITHPEDLKKDLIMVRRVIDNEIKTYSIDKRFYSKDGRIVWINLSVSLVRDSLFKPKYFISIVEDISDRKQFERELEESKWQREELIRGRDLASEAGGISNWSWDMVNNDLSWDARMYEIYGIDREITDLDYDVWRGQVHPDDIDDTEVKIKRTIEDLVSFSAEFRIYNKQTGDTRWVKAAADVVSKNGQAIKMFGVNLDITDERLTQIALKKEGQLARQANEAKSNFLAVMSHEIRTPMNSVIGMIDLLRETSLSPEQERMTATVRDSSFSLLEIINGILDFSKIESGQMELDLAPTSLLAIIERSAEALWGHAINHNAKLYILPELHVPERLLIDPVRIRQIIVNILGNAIKFSQDRNKQGVVFVRTSLVCGLDGELNIGIEVMDNGIGMSKSQQGKLFQPFTQADSSTTRKYGGTGLGLTITKSFVDMMNGYIDVESELYKGSSFNVVIPIEKDEEHKCELSNVDIISANVLVALIDESLNVVVCNVLEQVKCNFNNIDDVNIEMSNTDYINWNVDIVIVDSLDTVDEVMKVFDLSYMEKPNVLLLDEEISSDRGGVEGNTYIVRSQPLKPSELIYALSIMSGSESAAFDKWQDKEFCREHAGMVNLGDVDNSDSLILVAEDQPTNREVIGQQLSKLGYNFEMANDGIEALGKWRTGRFHLLLTDCHMPNMDGFELTSAIRNEEEMLCSGHRTTIIAITANALVGEADHCLESGMDDYVSKPVELDKLRKILSVWVRNQCLLIENTDEQPFVLEGDDNECDINSMSRQESPVNFDNLSKILGTSDKEVINTILSSFWSSLKSDYDDVLSAIHLRDGESLRRAAHTAKGASNSSAIIKLGQIFEGMEMFAIDESWGEIKKLEQELSLEIERLNDFFTKEKIIEDV